MKKQNKIFLLGLFIYLLSFPSLIIFQEPLRFIIPMILAVTGGVFSSFTLIIMMNEHKRNS